jgi:sugar/nucleoside kinase (ribokinase family)
MRFAIVGTVNRDRVIMPGGAEHSSLGGILYNALTLARCAAEGDTIRVVGRLGEDDRDEVLALLDRCPAIDSSGLVFRPGASNQAVLEYKSADHRVETLIDRVGPLSDYEIARAADADFVLANLISGWDFAPPQLALLSGAGARVLLDVQSLTLAPPGANGKRAFRAVPEWREWCANVEIVKGNAEEIAWFTGAGRDAVTELTRAARAVLDCGPRVMVTTLGARGCHVAWRGEEESEGDMRSRIVPAIAGVRVADPTGCGDAFASAFLADYARVEDPLRAACAGNAHAALVASTRGLDALLALPDAATYRDRLWREVRAGESNC